MADSSAAEAVGALVMADSSAAEADCGLALDYSADSAAGPDIGCTPAGDSAGILVECFADNLVEYSAGILAVCSHNFVADVEAVHSSAEVGVGFEDALDIAEFVAG
jgi:hypothetical protein